MRAAGSPLQETTVTMRGVWAALIVPWNDDDRPDVDRFAAEVRSYAGTGVRGVYTGGTTGDFYAQDDHAFEQITRTACREAPAADLPVQIGCTVLGTAQARRRIAVARSDGRCRPTGVAVPAPSFRR
jgi:dihydrodipicolinate synthase/N-acetylneuraminate lyase